MLSHVCIGIEKLDRGFNFYSKIFEIIGLKLKFHEPENNWAGWVKPEQPRPVFIIGQPYDQKPATTGNGQMVGLLAENREMVDLVYAAAIENGGQSEGGPGLRPDYHPDYYGAYFRDPDGNKLCICCHSAP